MSVTQLHLIQEVAKRIGYGSGTCSAAGLNTTIVDTSSDTPMDSGDASTLLQNAWAMIESDSAGTPLNVGEVRRISGYNTGTTTLTLSRGFSHATTTTQSYGIYMGLPPTRTGIVKGIDEYINEVLRNMTGRRYYLLTSVTDGDMEATGTTSYTLTDVTATKSTTAMLLGTQSMYAAVAAGVTGYVQFTNSAAPSVVEGQVYDLVVDIKALASANTYTATLYGYDSTNGATIADSVHTSAAGTRVLHTRITIPDSCQLLIPSLSIAAVGGTRYLYIDNFSVRNVSAREYALPSWITKREQVEDLVYWGGGNAEQDGDSSDADGRNWYSVPAWDVMEDRGGTTPFRIHFEGDIPEGYHLIVQARAPYTELTALTGTTDADEDLVVAKVLAMIYGDLEEPAKMSYWTNRVLALEYGKETMSLGRVWNGIQGLQ